jgi:hypothetical protein
VAVDVAAEARLKVKLQLGEIAETVTVTGPDVQENVNTTSASLTNVIDPRQVRDLPIQATDPTDLAGLQPGVAIRGNDTRTAAVSGLQGIGTHLSQDGINAMDNYIKTDSFFVRTSPSLNSTRELSITTGTLGSESGRGVGQLRLVTTGGTSQFHGNAWYLMRNSALEANNFFNNANATRRPDEHQHYFGFTSGGPVALPKWSGRETSFWFFSYEGFREHLGVTRNRTVLTPEARNGTFRYVGADGTIQSVDLVSLGNFKTLNSQTTSQLNAMPVFNNTLVGDGLNTAGAQFNVNADNQSNKVVLRFDHRLADHSSLGSHKVEFVLHRGAFSTSPDISSGLEAPFGGGASLGQVSTRWLITAALHSNFSTITNELRWGTQYGPVRFRRDIAPNGPFLDLSSVTDFDNRNLPQGRETRVTQIIDNFALPITSKHLLRAGFDFQQLFLRTTNDAGINETIVIGTNASNPNGLLPGLFPNLPAGGAGTTIVNRASSIYNDLAGVLSSASQTFNITSPTSGFVPGATRLRILRERDMAFYAMDQWHARRSLTFNFGLRWEYLGVPVIPNGLGIQVTNFNDIFGISGPGNLFNPTASLGSAPAKASLDFVSGTTGRTLYKDDRNNFAPFFGFAWSPDFRNGILGTMFGPQGRSSVRGGYSISYLHDGLSVIAVALGTGVTNPGLTQTASNNVPTGVLTSGGVPLSTPAFLMPVTDLDNFNVSSTNGLWAINPNLRIPYVQQWSLGFERSITRNTACRKSFDQELAHERL